MFFVIAGIDLLTTNSILCALYRITHTSQNTQLKTGGFCRSSKVLLLTCHYWWYIRCNTYSLLVSCMNAECVNRYWHRSLNPRKLIDVKFSHLSRNMTMQRTLKLYKLPEVSWCDVRSVHKSFFVCWVLILCFRCSFIYFLWMIVGTPAVVQLSSFYYQIFFKLGSGHLIRVAPSKFSPYLRACVNHSTDSAWWSKLSCFLA